MPCLGIGSWQVPEGNALLNSLSDAIHAGYRLIDTASIYGNERAVGIAMRNSGVPRSDFFLVDKVWNADRGYEKTLEAFRKSTALLGTSYLDLYMIHWPATHEEPITCQAINAGTWRALEKLYRDGSVRAIGVSNFYPARLADLCETVSVIPAVNQVELHPFFQQADALKLMQKYGVTPEAWGPFAEGNHDIFTHPVLTAIGAKYGKSAAQVALRWNVQRGVVVIPKSVKAERMAQNFDIWNFTLSAEDMAEIAKLDIGHSEIVDHNNPDFVKMLHQLKVHD